MKRFYNGKCAQVVDHVQFYDPTVHVSQACFGGLSCYVYYNTEKKQNMQQ